MPQKIKIIKLEKTEQYLAKELALLKGQAKALLTSTDWTQLPDSELSTACQLRFRIWRNLIRRLDYSDFDKSSQELEGLKTNRPEIKKSCGKYRFVTSNFNFADKLSLINSCNQILKELGIDESVSCSEDADAIENFFTVLKQNGY